MGPGSTAQDCGGTSPDSHLDSDHATWAKFLVTPPPGPTHSQQGPVTRREIEKPTVNDLVQFYSYAAFMYWPAALAGKLAFLSALIAVASGNQNPGQKLLTGVLAAHLLACSYILYMGLISVGLPFGPRALAGPVGEPVAILSFFIGATVAVSLISAKITWTTRSKYPWANGVFWIAMAVAVFHPFFNDSIPGAIFKSPLAVLPHPTLLAGCALVWMTGAQANRLAALAFIAGASLIGFYDALLWGIASSWLLVLYAAAAGVVVLAPDFHIKLPSTGEPRPARRDPSPRAPKAPTSKPRKSEAPKWKLK